MRLRDDKTGHDYTCTHVLNFKNVTKYPTTWIDCMDSVFSIKEYRSCNYYLDNDYNYYEGEAILYYGIQTYAK